MGTFFNNLAAGSVRNRIPSVLLILLITIVCTNGYVNPRILISLVESQPDKRLVENAAPKGDSVALPDVSPLSLSNSDAVVVVDSSEFFTPQGAMAMRKMVEDLEALDQVSSILWMDRVPILNIFGLPEPLLPRSTASAARFEAARQKALEHPLVGGQLLSGGTQTLLLLVKYNFDFVLDDDDATGLLRRTAAQSASQFPDVKMRVRVTGRVPAQLAAIASHEANQLKYQLIGYGMILLMALVLFRGIRPVIIVALAPLLGVYWTVGMIQYFDYNNPLIDVILPILVSLVGLTDGVHLMVQIRKLRAAGLDRTQAAIAGLQQVGLACFLTSLTTAVGLGSLMLAESSWVQQFGMCSMLGVLLCFIAVVTVIPLACSSWLGNNVHQGNESNLIDRNLNRVSGLIDWVLRYKGLVSTFGIVSSLLLGGLALTLTPDQRQSDGLPQKAEATQALQHVDQAFEGLEFANVDVHWSTEVESDSPEVLQVIRDIDDLLHTEKLVGHPLSIRNLIDAQPGSGPLEERMTLLELLPPPLKRAFYTPETRQASVAFRVQDLGIAAYGPVFERIEAGLVSITANHAQFELKLSGGAVRRWRNLYQIVVDLAASLGTASVIILIVLAVVFRSFRLGLISIIPNMFPLALTAAYLVVAGYNLEVVMVCNFTVCLGIAVDDTIHFLSRYCEERQKTDDIELAIRRAFTGVGTALIMTTAVLVAGFSIVTFSDSRDHQIFATMGALTIAAALFCDLVFLPALLAVFARKQDK